MEDYWQVPRRNPTRLTIRLELPQTVTESVDVPDTESKQPCGARRSRGLDPNVRLVPARDAEAVLSSSPKWVRPSAA